MGYNPEDDRDDPSDGARLFADEMDKAGEAVVDAAKALGDAIKVMIRNNAEQPFYIAFGKNHHVIWEEVQDITDMIADADWSKVHDYNEAEYDRPTDSAWKVGQ